MNIKKIVIIFTIILITILVIGNESLYNIEEITIKNSFLNVDLLQNFKPLNENIGSDNKEPSIIVGPYPQKPETDSIVIVWETSIATSNNSVHFGLNPICDNIVYNNYTNYFHEVALNGLTCSTKYYYKVISDSTESKIYSFYTKYDNNDTIRFIAYGDTRGVWDNWINASIVSDAIETQQPFFVLHTGDIVNNGQIPDQWVDFFSVSDFVHNSTLYPSIGNHESYGESYFKYFILPNNELWYSFNNGPVHFISLDSNFRNSLRLSQFFWLIKDLKSNKQQFTIVFFHHPPYSSGNHGSTIYLRLIWGFLFENFNVDIVFNGHDHCYERGKVKNVNYIVTGGGGAPLYNVSKSWWTNYSEKTFHYCLVSVNQEQLSFKAIKPDGTIVDTFVINK